MRLSKFQQQFVQILIFLIMKKDQKTMSVLMVGRIYEEDDVFRLIQIALSAFTRNSQADFYFMDGKTLQKVKTHHGQYKAHEFNIKMHENIIDYIVTIGGDGTILYGAKEFINQVPPLISFQRGSLGFMCRFPLTRIENVIDSVVSSHKNNAQLPYQKAHQIRLQTQKKIIRQNGLTISNKVCINEVYISRKAHEGISIEIYVNNQYLTHTSGDGILISTPTGSTAYSLSAGGPLLQNGVNGILIVPIAPHSLSFRPICFPSDCQIRIKLHKFSRSTAFVSYDGQTTQDFDFDHEILIKKAKHDIVCKTYSYQVLEPKKQQIQMPTWIQRLKFFLGWNQKYKLPQQYVPQINTHINKRQCIEDE